MYLLVVVSTWGLAFPSSCTVVLYTAGFDVLTAMERVSVDGDDRPEQEIKITGASVFVNPYKEMEEEERKKAEAERKQASCIRALYASLLFFSHCTVLHWDSQVLHTASDGVLFFFDVRVEHSVVNLHTLLKCKQLKSFSLTRHLLGVHGWTTFAIAVGHWDSMNETCYLSAQAEKEAGPLDIEEEGVGNWFSNPAGASNTTSTANGSGVGKYLSSLPKISNTQLATDSAPDIPAAPAVKKQKVKQTGYGNFDAW